MVRSSKIDLFTTNVNIESKVCGEICADISDQLPIFLVAEVDTSKKNVCSSQEDAVQNITPSTLNTFRLLLLRQNFESILTFHCVDDAYDKCFSINGEHYIACLGTNGN